jgi:hypothetical protein
MATANIHDLVQFVMDNTEKGEDKGEKKAVYMSQFATIE